MKISYRVFLFLCLFSFVSCNDLTLGTEPKNNPQANFDLLWQEYDRMYGLFEVKQIDWQAVYHLYRPEVTANTTEEDLFTIFSKMLSQLNDGHVWLLKPGPAYKRFDSGRAFPSDEFSLSVTKTYLEVVKEISSAEGRSIVYGRMSGNIGYLFLDDLGQSPSFYEKAMNEVLAYLSDTKSMIVDARSIEGGDDRSAQQVAGRFASKRKLYMTSRFRNGPQHSNFTAPLQWFVAPTGKTQYNKPVILLTTRTTGSAGESFTLAMRENVNVVHWGDTTQGIFSENPRRELPNGWIYSISVGDYRDAAGKSLEGIGIAPQVIAVNRKEDIQAGKDLVVEKALRSF